MTYLVLRVCTAYVLWAALRRLTRRHRGRRGRLRGAMSPRQQYRRCYLKSEHWARYRRDWWRKHPTAVCVDCGAGHPLDLHHLTYVRRGHEADGDVIPLCRSCHEARHGHRTSRTRVRLS